MEIDQENVKLFVDKRALCSALLGDRLAGSFPAHQDRLYLDVAARLKRHGREVRFVLPPNRHGEIPGRPIPSLLKAIARAHHWYGRVTEGNIPNPRSLAQQTGFNGRYVSRILQCAFLAPDIIEAILDGRQPHALTLRKLWNNLPTNWSEQRKRLGFPARSN